MIDRRVYVIGDIHGQFEMLRSAHELVAKDRARHPGDAVIVHAGDMVDRGPDSAGVIGWLLAGIERGEPWVVLKGNHDRMMALFLEDEPRPDPILRPDFDWLHERLGGRTTLGSYGVPEDEVDQARLHYMARQAVPSEHLTFLRGLDTVFSQDGLVCVHAGIRPGVPLHAQSEDDLLWIRDAFHHDRRDHGALIIHGHTPVDSVTHYGNRVNVDTGAGYGRPISAVVWEEGSLWQLTGDGRTPLRPMTGQNSK